MTDTDPPVNRIPVVFIVDSAYVMAVSVAMRSLLNHFDFNNRSCSGVVNSNSPTNNCEFWNSLSIIIVGIGLNDSHRDLLRSVVQDDKFRPSLSSSLIPEVTFIHLPEGECSFLTKLKLPDLLPTNLTKVLYLDADMLIRANITLLWTSKVVREVKTVAAVVDVGEDSSTYFNAGLLVMNLAFMRQEKIVEKMMHYVTNELPNGLSSLRLKEQDVLNKFFGQDNIGNENEPSYGWQELSIYWNVQGIGSYANFRLENDTPTQNKSSVRFSKSELLALESHAYIVHFTGSSRVELSCFNSYCPMPTKPWSGWIGPISSNANDCDDEDFSLNPYVLEWYSVLYSIPEYYGWLPTLIDPNLTQVSLARDINISQETEESRLIHLLHVYLKRLTKKMVEMKTFLSSLSATFPSSGEVQNKDKLAILLPITSKGLENVDDQLDDIAKLAHSCPKGMTNFYVGVDDNDAFYSNSAGGAGARDRLKHCFTDAGHAVEVMDFPVTTPPQICHIAQSLAKRAFDHAQENFYFLLLGDDVILHTPINSLLPLLRESFSLIARRSGIVPYGFGCVAFHDKSSSGFPTFPVVTRVHLDIFGEHQWCPDVFVNQDADPYLYELYRNYQASVFSSNLILQNKIGGANEANTITRYTKQHVHWQDEILQSGLQQIESYLLQRGSKLITKALPLHYKCIRLDIIVPSYRIQREYLQRIIELAIPPNCSTTVIIILDNPDDAVSHGLKEEFEQNYREKVRIRVNASNKGASFSRSRGLDESCADWILFLDDDVIPSEDILYKYCEEIVRSGYGRVHKQDKQYPGFAGYVGATDMPDYRDTSPTACTTTFTRGIQLVHLLHFWSDHVCATDRPFAPWGITAQLCVRRLHNQRFNECFPKTGGGEDIDLCLRTCAQLKNARLKNLPTAKCLHPWWNDGRVAISRFYGWAKGDSMLLDLYPQHCYYSYPNGLEMMLFITVAYLVLCCPRILIKRMILSHFILYLVIFITVFLADMFFELFHIMLETPYHLSEVRGWERVFSALQGLFFYRFLGADMGHVWHPLVARGRISHLCVRFDWWCGLYPCDVQNNLVRERNRFICMLLSMFVVGYAYMSLYHYLLENA